MEIILENVSKSFLDTIIIDKFNYRLFSGEKYAILGANGSGKSTLLAIISGLLKPNSGILKHLSKDGEPLSEELVYKQISLTGPYLQLVEDFTLLELIDFHLKFKTTYTEFTTKEFADMCKFNSKHYNVLFKNFSSGMRQRLKLGFAILIKGEVLLLDEPFSNLDSDSKNWYSQLLVNNLNGRTLVIASNEASEYEICENLIKPWK